MRCLFIVNMIFIINMIFIVNDNIAITKNDLPSLKSRRQSQANYHTFIYTN